MKGLRVLARLPYRLAASGHASAGRLLQQTFGLVHRDASTARGSLFLASCAHLQRNQYQAAPRDYPVYVLNRECDRERLRAFATQAARFSTPFVRLRAVDAASPNFDFRPYHAEIAGTFCGTTRFLRGAVGCFLSHAAAWRELLASDAELAMICEDDASILGALPALAREFDVPGNADVIFANERVGVGLLSEANLAALHERMFRHLPIAEALKTLAETEMAGPGTDGYLITRRGAEKLLRIYSRTGLHMELDWYLLLHSLSPQSRSAFLDADGTGRFSEISFDHESLHSYAMLPILVVQRSTDSTIAHEQPGNYIDREDMMQAGEDNPCG